MISFKNVLILKKIAFTWFLPLLLPLDWLFPALDTVLSESEKMAISVHQIQSMSAYKAISLKKQQKSKYNLCKHQFRGNLKIKNQSISPKRLVGIESKVSHHVLLNFLDYNSLSELLKNFPYITLKRKQRVTLIVMKYF